MKRIAVTSLISITKCEKQTVLNSIYKPKLNEEIKNRQKMGIKDHKKFENLNNKYSNDTSKVIEQMNKKDKRCYVATAIFGAYSPETLILRQWRDNKLKKHLLGRLFIKAYYNISPLLLRFLPKWTMPISKYFLLNIIKIIK